MFIYFSLVFLLGGLPIVFSIEVLMGYNKLIVYGLVTFFLLLPLYSIFKLNLKINYSKIILFLIFFALFIFLFIEIESISNKQFIDIIILNYIFFISLFYDKKLVRKEENLIFILLLVLAISIIMTYFSTNTTFSYWSLYGGRLYIGDTKNPNLVSFVSLLYIIIAFYTIIKKLKIKKLYLFSIVSIMPLALYLYFLSFSKSCIIGFFLVLLYFMLKYKISFKILLIFIIAIICIFLIADFPDKNYISILVETYKSLILGSNANMSASIRHENFSIFFKKYFEINLFGNGANTFRLDSPIIQLYIDFGLISIIMFIMSIVYPFILIARKIKKKSLSISEDLAIIIYLFFLPNLFFHGTPYEYSTWLPTILFYMLI